MDSKPANPIDVLEKIAQTQDWLHKREDLELSSQVTFASHDTKSALSQVKWFPDNSVLLSAAVWPYSNEGVAHLQMHRATAQVNSDFWQGVTYWDERTESIVIKSGKSLRCGVITEEAMGAFQLLPIHALRSLLATFDSFAYSNNEHLETLMRANPASISS